MCSRQSEDPMKSIVGANYMCKLCKKVLKKPMQSPCSGFRFCKACAEKLQKDNKGNSRCPFCEEPDSSEIHKIFPDKAAEKELLASTAVQNSSWRGLIQQYENDTEADLAARMSEIIELAQKLEEISKLEQEQINKGKEQWDAMNCRLRLLEGQLASKDAIISQMELRISDMEETSYEGTLLWKITDFNRRRQEAISGGMTSIYSPVFYTGKDGYKMCARLYLNGDGMGKGTHVSVFFVIMRGQYDALLKWPFRQKVTLMFLDQSGKDQHVSDAFRPDPTSSSFKRPTTEMNIASGCPLFMTLTQLDNPLHAFVKDDTGFIEISVSHNNLS